MVEVETLKKASDMMEAVLKSNGGSIEEVLVYRLQNFLTRPEVENKVILYGLSLIERMHINGKLKHLTTHKDIFLVFVACLIISHKMMKEGYSWLDFYCQAVNIDISCMTGCERCVIEWLDYNTYATSM
jgi:hypothetical protein